MVPRSKTIDTESQFTSHTLLFTGYVVYKKIIKSNKGCPQGQIFGTYKSTKTTELTHIVSDQTSCTRKKKTH